MLFGSIKYKKLLK